MLKCLSMNKFLIIQTFRSLSSEKPISLPYATAKRFPCTKFPTITEAGPTDVSVTHPDELPETWCCWSAPIFLCGLCFFYPLWWEGGSSSSSCSSSSCSRSSNSRVVMVVVVVVVVVVIVVVYYRNVYQVV